MILCICKALYNFKKEKIMTQEELKQFKAMRIAVEKIRSCIKEGKSFNQETTLAGHSIIKTI